MRDKITSFLLSAGSGTATYITTNGQEIILSIILAFLFGAIGLFGNEFAKWILKKLKKGKKK
jgi:hypothetical protein